MGFQLPRNLTTRGREHDFELGATARTSLFEEEIAKIWELAAMIIPGERGED